MFKITIAAGFLFGCSWGETKTNIGASGGKDSVYKKDMIFSAASFEVPATRFSRRPENINTYFTVLPDAKDSAGQEIDSLFVPYGVQYVVTLPIDIKIYLNSGSLLVFNPVDSRSLQIRGEAIVEIGKHPGTVKVGDSLWINSGVNSRFYISNYTDYPEEPLLVAGMINGEGELQGEIANRLYTGKHILVDSATKVIGVTQVDSTALLKWTQQEFYFDEVDAYKILKKVSRWYNVSLDVPPESIHDINFRVIKKYDEPLDSFLESINRAMNGQLFIVKDNSIRLGNIRF